MNASSRRDSVPHRIVDAASEEFATYGIAGARVDRIAKVAKTSKERVYAYFRSKEDLYEHVSMQHLRTIAEATKLEPTNLPEYAGRIHDYFVNNPQSRRLARWGALEITRADPRALEVAQQKVALIRAAQHDGLLDQVWDPLDILVFVNQLATSWVDQPINPEISDKQYIQTLKNRRAAIVAAVHKLFPASSD